MNGCTATDKPLIEILLATYEPRMDWLGELLESLNCQTWPNLFLRVIDDHSPKARIEDIDALVREKITAFPFSVARADENRGSNAVFAELTRRAGGIISPTAIRTMYGTPTRSSVLSAL